MVNKLHSLLIAILLVVSLPANADLICKGKQVIGFSQFDVLRYCGEPIMKDSYLKAGMLRVNHRSGEDVGKVSTDDITWSEVQQWFYTVGFRKTSYAVEFENGKVVRVIKGEDSP